MAEDLIRYDVLLQDALRGVVHRVLSEVQKTGLPGEHHFFIQFNTTAPGVRISSRLKEQYPEEMTIVIQHQYWELQVFETYFEVGLSFGSVPEKLVVPFTAMRGFFDPSVQFGLQIDPEAQSLDNAVVAEIDKNDSAAAATSNTLAVIEGHSAGASGETASESPSQEDQHSPELTSVSPEDEDDDKTATEDASPGTAAGTATGAATGTLPATAETEKSDESEAAPSADVVSLDSFRKRT